jgi:uroporphyrinogen decarboxylase
MSMTKRERLSAAIRGEATDRPLVALWRHFPIDDRDPRELAESAAAFQRACDWDFLKLTPSSHYSVAGWGAEVAFRGNPEGSSAYVTQPVRTAEDWTRLTPLDPDRGALASQLEAIRRTRALVGPNVPIIDTVFSPLGQARHLAGRGFEIISLRRHRRAIQQALEVITETTARYVEAALGAGADGIFYAIRHASAVLLSEDEYRELCRPHDLRVLESARGASFTLLHLHGHDTYFDLVADYPVHALNWHDRETGPSLADGAQRFPGLMVGGVSQADIVEGSPEAVRALARAAIESLGGRRLCLSTGCVLPTHAPWVNIRALRSAVEGDRGA